MSVRIVTDSTCDLPAEVIQRYGITVLPLYINFGEESYRDGVNLTRQEFYQRLPASQIHPTTAVPGPELFRQEYERLADEGADAVLSIHISTALSAVVDVAGSAARQTSAVPVTVMDSRQLSLGTGFLVKAAAQAAADGASISDILSLIEEQIGRTHVFAALDTLEFLRRSGRMHFAMASLGTLLQIKPLLKMYDGQPTTERVRTSAQASRRLVDLLAEAAPLESVALVHTHAPEKAEALRQKAGKLLPAGGVLSVDITPVIGAHLGPGAVGLACVTAQP